MAPKPKTPGGGGGGNTPNTGGKPPQTHGNINAGSGITSAQNATGQAMNAGLPNAGQGTNPQPVPNTPNGYPPPPTAPPGAASIHHSAASETHITVGDGGKQGGHLAGTGLAGKTEFPNGWDGPKILDAAHQVTQQGPPVTGPKPTKDANGNPAWAYNYEGVVDGVTIRTTVLSTGEIRTAFPTNASDPGVILNPSAPSPAPSGIPQGVAPRYDHPDVGGTGSWTWEGPKGDKIIRVEQDAQGNVTTTVIGDYKKK